MFVDAGTTGVVIGRAEAYLGDRSRCCLDFAGHDKPVAVAEQNIEDGVDDAADDKAKARLSWKSSGVVLLPRAQSRRRMPHPSFRSERSAP